MRYTEVRLTRLAEEMLKDDIDKETVDWVLNYDGSEVEPTVLPAKVAEPAGQRLGGHRRRHGDEHPAPQPRPRSSTLPDADRTSRRSRWKSLMEAIPGPDFPTAGFIFGLEGIRTAYATGRGIDRVAGPGGDRGAFPARRTARRSSSPSFPTR